MRLVSLRNDSGVFRQHVNHTLYLIFKNRNSEFQQMINDQSPFFWVGFTITLRYVLSKKRYMEFCCRSNNDYGESFFIGLHDLLVSNRPKDVAVYVNNVVAMAQYGKFFNCFEAAQPEYHNISTEIDSLDAFKNLFGNRKDKNVQDKVYQTRRLHFFAVGSLLEVFRLWLTAGPCNKVDWEVPPSCYEEMDQCLLTWRVKQCWGSAVLDMLPELGKLPWWSSDNLEKREMYQTSAHLHFVDKDTTSYLRNLEFVDMKELPFIWYRKDCNHMENVRLSCIRHLHLSDCSLIFHPYAQFASSFHAEIFNSFHGEKKPAGVGLLFMTLHGKGDIKLSDSKNPGNLYSEAVDAYVEVKKAIEMDASFHESMARQTTWVSAETLARLLWNMQLCIEWLEWLLVQTYKFEACFLPFCHFPIRKKFVNIMERMYALFSHEPRLLAKAAIIIAEHIQEEERTRNYQCRYDRELLKFCLERLIPKMKSFSDGSCYALLEFILKNAWTDDERLTGTISSRVPKSDFGYVQDGPTADLNIDLIFASNYRSYVYWLPFFPLKDVEFSFSDYLRATEKVEAFKKLINKNVSSKHKKRCSLKYDLQYYKKFSSPPDKGIFSSPLESLVVAFSLLSRDEFLQLSALTHLTSSAKGKALVMAYSGAVENFPGLECVDLLNIVFFTESLDSTFDVDNEPNNLLGLLWLTELQRTSMDIIGRLGAVLNLAYLNFSCPAPKFFLRCWDKISNNRGGPTVSSIQQANEMLCEMGFEDLIVLGEEPKVVEDPSLLVNPVEELELRRVELLRAVGAEQFKKQCRNSEDDYKYPLYALLEYRFVEELAALRKSVKMGFKQAEQRLLQLLSFRFNWMVAEYERWKAGAQGEVEASYSPKILKQFREMCTLKAKILAVLIPLKSIFTAYLSPFCTTHPFSKTSENLLLRLVELWIANSLRCCMPDFLDIWYTALERTGLFYLEKLLDDCIQVWCIPEFYCAPSIVPVDALHHAQLVHVGITQLLLVMVHRRQTPDSHEQSKVLHAAAATLVKAGTLLRLEALGAKAGVLQEVGSHYLAVYGMLVPLAHALQLSQDQKRPDDVSWRGWSQQWHDCIHACTTGCLVPFFEKIHFDEFMTKTSDKQIQTVHKELTDGATDMVLKEMATVVGESDVGNNVTGTVSGGDSVLGETADSSVNSVPESAAKQVTNSGNETTPSGMGNIQKCDKDGLNAETCREDDSKTASEGHLASGDGDFAAAPAVDSSPNAPLNCCFGCQKMETLPETFTKCERCTLEKWMVIRVYCSLDCHEGDWNRRHAHEHDVGEKESDYEADSDLEID